MTSTRVHLAIALAATLVGASGCSPAADDSVDASESEWTEASSKPLNEEGKVLRALAPLPPDAHQDKGTIGDEYAIENSYAIYEGKDPEGNPCILDVEHSKGRAPDVPPFVSISLVPYGWSPEYGHELSSITFEISESRTGYVAGKSQLFSDGKYRDANWEVWAFDDPNGGMKVKRKVGLIKSETYECRNPVLTKKTR